MQDTESAINAMNDANGAKTENDANAEKTDLTQIDATVGAHRPIARPKDGKEVTPEMRALAEALAHPEGDPYLNGRRLGFYCENCG